MFVLQGLLQPLRIKTFFYISSSIASSLCHCLSHHSNVSLIVYNADVEGKYDASMHDLIWYALFSLDL